MRILRDSNSRGRRFVLLLVVSVLLGGAATDTLNAEAPTDANGVPRQAINTQDPEDTPSAPLEALAALKVPDGFEVSLFAGEPDVHQPLAFTFDDRGRLWVIENYSYPEWNAEAYDRIVIFEDTDQDGQFDKKKVFLDDGHQLTGIEIGFGGVWCTAAPYLIFIPDDDRDDQPDGPPQILLDGFNLREVGHNVVNGLRWSPDGWLYGRHGIKATSHVGAPGTSAKQRVMLNCSIWRFHPTRKIFEVVSHGTTNPWGFDYDDYGEMFFTNNVIGHLWHLLPGARYQRMFGSHLNPNTFVSMNSTSDHLHFAGGLWSESRKEIGKPNLHDEYGGGHSHCGGMIYLGDNWPAQYRGKMFMCNTHGKRVNMDALRREGSSYTAEHGQDFLFANSDWFRGVELKYGPDGGVFLTDWTDLGECHDRDGIHRRSGRIYKITYGKPRRLAAFDLQDLSTAELVALQNHKNDWFVRHARRILQERAVGGGDLSTAVILLKKNFHGSVDATRKLRFLWCLHALGQSAAVLEDLLNDTNEHLRVWGVRLLFENDLSSKNRATVLADLARRETSGLVRLHIAAAMAKVSNVLRWAVAAALVEKMPVADDERLMAMIWYAIEPVVLETTGEALQFSMTSDAALLQEFVARRITVSAVSHAGNFEKLMAVMVRQQETLNEAQSQEVLPMLMGLGVGVRGQRQIEMPKSWRSFADLVKASGNEKGRQLVQQVGAVFGDGVALAQLVSVARNKDLAAEVRSTAVNSLVSVSGEGVDSELKIPELLQGMSGDRAVQMAAIRGLRRFKHLQTPKLLLGRYASLDKPLKNAVIDTLSSREDYAFELLAALETGRVPRDHVTPQQARQISNIGNAELTDKLSDLWGAVQFSSESQLEKITQIKAMLATQSVVRPDLSQGRAIYKQRCANCHKLFGEGEKIGPDLTGSGRANIDYALQNVVTPSAVVAKGFQVSVVVTVAGRILTGVVTQESEQVLLIQTDKEQIRLPKAEVDEIRKSKQSLMPANLLKDLTDEQIRNLIAYLASPIQVPVSSVDDITNVKDSAVE
ncbi:MAG: c-type cytochrome [Planctomycetaceae bacterium]|nr:c-type cytochrome [Planctomycetaceae bacterium]